MIANYRYDLQALLGIWTFQSNRSDLGSQFGKPLHAQSACPAFYSANQTTLVAPNVGSGTRECVRGRSGYVQVAQRPGFRLPMPVPHLRPEGRFRGLICLLK